MSKAESAKRCASVQGAGLPWMLRCEWKQSLPILDRMAFAEGDNIPRRSAAHAACQPQGGGPAFLEADDALMAQAKASADWAVRAAGGSGLDEGTRVQRPAEVGFVWPASALDSIVCWRMTLGVSRPGSLDCRWLVSISRLLLRCI